MSPRSPEEILKAIEDADADDAVDRVLAMGPEERRRELEASGVDVSALHAKADAFYARLHDEAHEEQPTHRPDSETRSADGGAAWDARVPVVARRRISPRWVALFAAALGAVAIGATAALPAFLAKRDQRPSPHDSPSSATASLRPTPRQLRERATAECSEHRWQECVDDLTAARTLDPAGDADERVQGAWKDGLRGLERQLRPAPRFDTK